MPQRMSASAGLTVLLAHALACSSGTETDSASAAVAAGPSGASAETVPAGASTAAADDVQANELPVTPGSVEGATADDRLLTGAEPPPIEEPEACAGVVMEPEILTHIPVVTMYIVLDNSGSMAHNGKWDGAKKALGDFVSDPASAGIKATIQYFHPQNVMGAPDRRARGQSNNPFECDGVAHAQPAVEVGMLPEVAPTIVASLEAEEPDGNTPTVGALTGGVDFCADFQEKHPGEECVVVFVTDGQPNGCGLQQDCAPGFTPDARGGCVDPLSKAVLVPIAQAAYDDHGVGVYTVGMEGVSPDGFDLLDTLAAVSGSDCSPKVPGNEACNVTETGGAGLLEALNLIRDFIARGTRVPCTWALPKPPNGQRLDPGLVNVSLTLRGAELPLGQVATEAECSSVEGGWYYDLPQAPTELRTCAQTCDVVEQNAESVRVSLEFGCATKKARVR